MRWSQRAYNTGNIPQRCGETAEVQTRETNELYISIYERRNYRREVSMFKRSSLSCTSNAHVVGGNLHPLKGYLFTCLLASP
jgi:hypothetical protein